MVYIIQEQVLTWFTQRDSNVGNVDLKDKIMANSSVPKVRKHLNFTVKKNPIEAETTVKSETPTTAVIPWEPAHSKLSPPPPSRAWAHLSQRDENNVAKNDDGYDDNDYDDEPLENTDDLSPTTTISLDFKTIALTAIGFSFARVLSLNLALPPPLVAGTLLVAAWQGTREGRFAQYRTPILIGTALALIETVLPLKIKPKS